MESQKYWQSSINIDGEQGFPLKVFFLISTITLPRSYLINSRNLGLMSESLTFDISCSFFSSSTGRINMKQSRSLKKLISSFLMLFLRMTKSELPFWSFKAFYKYSWGVIFLPFSSSSLKAKSLTNHKNVGKQFKISCLSFYEPFWSILLKLIIKLRFWTAFSSILPTLL